MNPIIGITTPMSKGRTQNLAIRTCLYLSGAQTINLTPKEPRFDDRIDGLVLSGGTHLHPSLFLSSNIQKNYSYDPDRDALEMKWIEIAQKRKIPIFCICRGTQLLNVFEGGTLHTDIKKVYQNANYPNSLIAKIFFRKKIVIKEDSWLNEVFDKNETTVNSMHSQAIGKIGASLEVSAVEENGIIQAVEHEGKQFIMGFQFHPEFLFYRSDIRKLFRKFVKYCRK